MDRDMNRRDSARFEAQHRAHFARNGGHFTPSANHGTPARERR